MITVTRVTAKVSRRYWYRLYEDQSKTLTAVALTGAGSRAARIGVPRARSGSVRISSFDLESGSRRHSAHSGQKIKASPTSANRIRQVSPARDLRPHSAQ